MTITLPQVADQNNLDLAWIRAKSYAESFDIYYDLEQYEQFERHLTANLRVLRSRLLAGYNPEPLVGIRMQKPGGHRDIYMLSVWDNVASMAFLNLLAPDVETIISNKSAGQSFGNRFDLTNPSQVLVDWQDQHGTFSAKLREIEALPDDYWYIRSDVSNYYPSIHIERVLALLTPLVEREVYDLISAFLHLQGRINNDELVDVEGLPIGPVYSHLFANLYLAEFDEWIRSRAIHYVRYVDDFFYAGPSEEEVLSRFAEAQTYLAGIGLTTHPDKTERYPVTDTSCIESTITRLKYNIRMETPELKAAGLEDVAEALLYEAFIDTGFFKTPQTTAFVGWRLKDLGYSDIASWSDIACEVLKMGSLKPSEIRRLLMFLIQNDQDEVPEKLLEYLEEANDVATQLIAIDVIDDFPSYAQKASLDLLNALRTSDSFLVRAHFYGTFGNNLVGQISFDELIQQFDDEGSCFVKARLISLIIRQYPDQQIGIQLPVWVQEASEVKLAILNSADVLERRIVTQALVPSLALNDIEFIHFSAYVYLLILHSIENQLDDFIKQQEIIAIEKDLIESLAGLAQEAFDMLLTRQDHFGCYELLSIIGSIDPNLTIESIDRLRRETVSSRIADLLAERLDEATAEATDQTRIWSLENDGNPRKVFLQQYYIEKELVALKLPSNGLYNVVCVDGDNRGLLELLPVAKLESYGLSSTDFLEIIIALSSGGVCCEVEYGEIELNPGVDYVWVVYRYSPVFSPLAERIETSRIDEKMQTLLTIANQIDISGQADNLQSIHAHSLLINDTGDVQLCGIGTSIIDPSYLFTFSSDIFSEGLGKPNLSFCFGLLLYEYLSGQSPHQYLQATKRRRHSLHEEALHNLCPDREIPHLRYVFTRSTSYQPDYRYNDIRPLIQDLERIYQYLHRVYTSALARPKVPLWPLELADYIEFRFHIILRNPRLKPPDYGPFERRAYICEQLTQELATFLSELDLTANDITHYTRKAFKAPHYVRYSSPATQQLVKLSEFLWGITSEANSTFNTNYTLQVPILLLTRALDFEFRLLVYALAVDLLDTKGDPGQSTTNSEAWSKVEDVADVWVGPSSSPHTKVSLEIGAARVGQLKQIIDQLSMPKKAQSHLGDSIDAAILAALFTQDLYLHVADGKYTFEELWIAPKKKEKQVLRLAFLASALEEELRSMLHSPDDINPHNVCQSRIWPLFLLLQRFRSTKRLRGKIVDYRRDRQQGEFKWPNLLFVLQTYRWQIREILHFGLEPSKTSKMAATMDISSHHDKDILAVITPVSRSPLLKLDNRLNKARHWCRAHPWICTSIITLLLISITMFIANKASVGIFSLALEIAFIFLGFVIDDLRALFKEQFNQEHLE